MLKALELNQVHALWLHVIEEKIQRLTERSESEPRFSPEC